ncbi:hypothetical protein [Streptomyces collinus]|uniref:hypothetical protein n=1 Tax=Streptomyces collinus TaxID=42684 RepID=UPI0033FA5D56
MNESTTHRWATGHETTAVQVHTRAPITHAPALPVLPVQPQHVPAVASIVMPDGRVITGYALKPMQPEPAAAKPPVSRAAVNVALGGVGFLAVCGGLLLLTTVIAALTALIAQLITLAGVIFGGSIALQVFSTSDRSSGTTVNIRKAMFKRNHFNG